MKILAAVTVTVSALVIAYSAYSLYHTVKSKNGGATPLGAWVKARARRGSLDRELEKILRDTGKR